MSEKEALLMAPRTIFRGALALATAMLFCSPAGAVDITGAGSTFAYPLIAEWAEAYKAKTGVSVNYQSIGSGGGIKQIKSKTLDFGASDMPLEAEDLEASDLVQFPAMVGGIVPVVNVKSIATGQLSLDGKTLAAIYLGTIKKWNDPQIAALNPDLKLPDQFIALVFRSDGSGTTFLFTDYLSKVSPEFKEKVGSGTLVQWPVGLGGKGNEGVAALTARLAGSIGYVEYAFVKHTGMTHALMRNHDGKVVAPEIESFQAAASNADWVKTPGFGVVLTDQPGERSWPITGASFILVHRNTEKPESVRQVLDFFAWAYREGGKIAEEIDYVPMPEPVVKLIEASWKEIRGPNGQPVWSGS
jgi:phosphate transport system substrate-binding protein